MAGAGYKLFNTGDVLTAAQVNTYLMQQTVMVFASSAARTSALSGVLAEGMVSYLQDTNTLEVYDGSAWVGATGDITGLTAGTGISISSATGPVPTITSDVATTFDAKGDLVVGTGADTFSKLTVGNSGDTIVADSSATTGLRWQGSMAAGKNAIINGGFDIWQRGTSVAGATSSSTGFAADRWQIFRAGFASGSTLSRQVTGDATNLPFIQYCARVQRDSGNTSTAAVQFSQNLESVTAIPYAGKAVAVSFYARAGANFSAASSTLAAVIYSGTGTDQNGTTGAGYTGSNLVISQGVTLTTNWQRFSFTTTIPTTATEWYINFSYTPVGTAGANDYFEITGVQVEVGSVPTQFTRAGGTLAGELAACQRYYYRNTADGAYSGLGYGTASSGVDFVAKLVLPVQMRTAPSSVDYSTVRLSDELTGYTVTSVLLNTAITNRNTASLAMTVASGLTTFRFYTIQANNSTSAYLGVSAEL